MNAASTVIPLFPLNTVLYTGGRLPLRIFETRYVDMVREALRGDTGFGVVLLREGAEAGGSVTFHRVGTYARIVGFDQLRDGFLGITAQGERPFRVIEHHVAADALNRARIEWLDEPAALPLDAVDEPYADLLRHVLSQVGPLYPDEAQNFADAGWVVGRLLELLPLPLLDKQVCLEENSLERRLEYLRSRVKVARDTGPPVN